jgi:hypothetical protein
VAAFPADVLAAFAEREEIELETAAPSRGAGATRRTIIWVMVEGSDVFVRSVRGAQGRWFQELLADPKAEVRFRGRPKVASVAVRGVPAPDPASVAACSRALERKYKGDPSLGSMLRPDVLATTLRLEPA